MSAGHWEKLRDGQRVDCADCIVVRRAAEADGRIPTAVRRAKWRWTPNAGEAMLTCTSHYIVRVENGQR